MVHEAGSIKKSRIVFRTVLTGYYQVGMKFSTKAKRTPIGGFLGALSDYTASQLAYSVIKDLCYGMPSDYSAIDSVCLIQW